ncbi:MAG: hypothetical protein A2095_09260 [Sphingomonadales bacterium GWF1_63_6]|nr:MAG: hypothetical protein A2095_09260 [Sphingomonadales bacterium GWF1_63_6]
MQEFIDQLNSDGISSETVDPGTRKGGDDAASPSRWKTYYRSSCFPQWGVLIAFPENDEKVADVVGRLTEEAANYPLLKAAGHEVPSTAGQASETIDHLFGRIGAALVTEHVDGFGPYKARTEAKRLMRIANGFSDAARARARSSWAQLQGATRERAPMDLQVMLSSTGRIVVIDPEKTTTSVPWALTDWDDTLVVPDANPFGQLMSAISRDE